MRSRRLTRWIASSLLTLACAACARDSNLVRGGGTIEMDEVDVASLIGGRVAVLRVDEGDTVNAGDTIAVLDRGEVTAELQAQRAEAERAAAQYRDLRAGPRTAEVESARAALAAATAAAALAETELQRIEELRKRDVASQADLDRARSTRDQAVARRKQAAEQLRLVQEGFRRQHVEAAAKAAEVARAQVAGTLSRVGELVLTAPVSGVVLLKNFDRGEVVQPGAPVVTLGNPDSLWMRVFIAAPMLPRVHLGDPVDVKVHGVDHAFPGRVVEIASKAEFTPRAALTEEEQANLVFGVKVALAPSRGALKAGLPADAFIRAPANGKAP